VPGFQVCRSIKHHVGTARRFGKGDDFANVRLIGQQHHEPIDSGSHASVGRRAVLKRVQHVAEPFLSFLVTIAQAPENSRLDIPAVNTDAAA